MNWEKLKEERLKRFEKAKKKGEVDSGVIPILEKVNKSPNYCSLSSCAGRIVILDLPEFGDKLNANFRGKWHRKVSLEEILNSIKKVKNQGWFKLEGAIFHIASNTLENAQNLLNAGLKSGFKRSSIISIKNNIVEIKGTGDFELPVSEKNKLLVSKNYLKFLIEIANKKIEKNKTRLERLEKEIINLK